MRKRKLRKLSWRQNIEAIEAISVFICQSIYYYSAKTTWFEMFLWFNRNQTYHFFFNSSNIPIYFFHFIISLAIHHTPFLWLIWFVHNSSFTDFKLFSFLISTERLTALKIQYTNLQPISNNRCYDQEKTGKKLIENVGYGLAKLYRGTLNIQWAHTRKHLVCSLPSHVGFCCSDQFPYVLHCRWLGPTSLYPAKHLKVTTVHIGNCEGSVLLDVTAPFGISPGLLQPLRTIGRQKHRPLHVVFKSKCSVSKPVNRRGE